MSLKNVSARLLRDGSTPQIVLEKNGKTLESLPIYPASTQHRSIILSTWIRSYQPTALKSLAKEVYLQEEPKVAESKWMNSYVVSSNEDPMVVHAWCCGLSDGNLYMVYVPPELRRMGLARALIGFTCGQDIRAAHKWPHEPTPRGFNSWLYNPYLLTKN